MIPITLECDEAFSSEKSGDDSTEWNKVKALVNGNNVSMYLAGILRAIYEDDADCPWIDYDIVSQCMLVKGAEGFTLDDFGSYVEDVRFTAYTDDGGE